MQSSEKFWRFHFSVQVHQRPETAGVIILDLNLSFSLFGIQNNHIGIDAGWNYGHQVMEDRKSVSRFW